VAAYVPDAGDIVGLPFDPRAGHEQAGHRPALVLSLTSRPSTVLADQLKSLDWRARGAVHKGAVSPDILADVQAKIKALLRL
jgi:mRNA interferase MazF